ncbi:MAG: HAD-IC family P-type ATPase, partial [Clostridia bacterium]|nr:HAD-IC family P-type ATPase [Clostridia bacterium]
MDFHSQSQENVLQTLNTNVTQGLSPAEVEKRLAEYGKNQLTQKKPKTNLQRFFEQFKDVMILILLAAAVVSFVIAIVEKNPGELFEPFLIRLIVVINAVMGVIQESKAEKALEALKNMSAPHSRVIRDGKETVIEAVDLVPGDIIRLEAGDFVPADARLIYSSNLKSEESALTGESVPSEKDARVEVASDAPLGDRSNMIYSGCSITYGTATAVVTGTGMSTEMGKIANLLQGEGDGGETPLQKKLSQLGKYLGFLALGVCAIIFVIGLLNDIPAMEIFMTAVSLAVSAIPEGLPAIVTIVLSIGVQRLAKKNAIIRRLPAVETLGGASIICSDKTGTLTQNRMTLVKAYLTDGNRSEDISENNGDAVRTLLNYGTLCCNGSLDFSGDKVVHIGDPTETAIIFSAHNNGFEQKVLDEKYPRIADLPFDSDRKLMTSVNLIDGKKLVIVKGAVDMMIPRCTNAADEIDAIKAANDEM